MKKFLLAVLAGAVALPMSASAASIPANTIFNGQSQAWGNAGQNIQATFRVNVAAGEVVHAIRTKVDSQATVCLPIGPFEGAQDVDVTVNVVLPPNSNTSGYNLTGELFTTATLPQAEAMTGNLACTGANTNAYTGTNVLHVLPASGSSSGSSSGAPSAIQTQIDSLAASVKALTDALAKLIAGNVGNTPAPTPTKPACPPSGSTSLVQTWLLNNGYAAGFHAHGVFSATGNWGPITTDAYAAASAACK